MSSGGWLVGQRRQSSFVVPVRLATTNETKEAVVVPLRSFISFIPQNHSNNIVFGGLSAPPFKTNLQDCQPPQPPSRERTNNVVVTLWTLSPI